MTNRRQHLTRRVGVVLLWLCLLASLLAAFTAASGGVRFEIAGVVVSMRTTLRPVVAALVFGIGAAIMLGRDAAQLRFEGVHGAVTRHGLLIACAFAAVIALTTFESGTHVAGGTDSAGYLSEARLWRTGSLRINTPLANELTLANGQFPFTPAGYRPAGVGVAVPGYPPGLPLHFALASMLAGERAPFLVVPLCAGGLGIIAFLLGRRLGGADAALIAAATCGASPILLFQAMQPMSDVPAAFWFSLAIVLLLNQWGIAAGVAAAIACLVRPNLFAMVPLVAALSVWWSGWARAAVVRAVVFVTPVVLAALAFIYLQQTLFGGATRTGYGPVETLFSLDHVWRNLARYSRWTFFVQSWLIVAALAAPMVIRRGWVPVGIDPVRAERVAWSGLILYAALQAMYLLYLVFDDWVYFRFLLPALPVVLVLQAVTIAAICRRVAYPMRGLAVILIAVLAASWGVGRARGLSAFQLRYSEQRYQDVAEFVRELPPDAVFMTLQYSGSLWYYNAASILRWDWIDAGEIDAAVSTLSRKGRRVFAIVDDWELPQIRARYAGTRVVTRMITPLFSTGMPRGIQGLIFEITDTTAGVALGPVSVPAPQGRGAPLFAAGAPREIIATVYAIRGAPRAAAGAPVSSRRPPVPRIPRTPAAPGP